MSLCRCIDRLNNMAKWIRGKLKKSKLGITKAVLGLYVLFLLEVGIIAVVFLPNIVPNISRTCLPNRGDSLECGQTEERVDSFISDVLEKKYNQIVEKKKNIRQKQFDDMAMISSNSAINSKMKPAAKLVGKTLPPKNVTIDAWCIVDPWCNGVELDSKGGFLRHGVRYYKGRLVVPVSGTYFVYSFVEFYEYCYYSNGTPIVKSPSDPIKHALFKYSIIGGENVDIALSAQPHKIAKNKYENVYSSHISTVVDLNSGDELSVQVNNVSLLHKHALDNYFGLVLIE